MKELLDLYFTFFKLGAVTFGGGYAMLALSVCPIRGSQLPQRGSQGVQSVPVRQTTILPSAYLFPRPEYDFALQKDRFCATIPPTFFRRKEMF